MLYEHPQLTKQIRDTHVSYAVRNDVPEQLKKTHIQTSVTGIITSLCMYNKIKKRKANGDIRDKIKKIKI